MKIDMQWLEKGQYAANTDLVCLSCESTRINPVEITFTQDSEVCLRVVCDRCGRNMKHMFKFERVEEYEAYPCDDEDYVNFGKPGFKSKKG